MKEEEGEKRHASAVERAKNTSTKSRDRRGVGRKKRGENAGWMYGKEERRKIRARWIRRKEEEEKKRDPQNSDKSSLP